MSLNVNFITFLVKTSSNYLHRFLLGDLATPQVTPEMKADETTTDCVGVRWPSWHPTNSATALKAQLFESNHTSIIITRHDEQSALMHTRWCGCWYPCSECQVQVYQAASAPAVNPNVTNWLHDAPCCHYYRHLTTNQSLYTMQAGRSQSQWYFVHYTFAQQTPNAHIINFICLDKTVLIQLKNVSVHIYKNVAVIAKIIITIYFTTKYTEPNNLDIIATDHSRQGFKSRFELFYW